VSTQQGGDSQPVSVRPVKPTGYEMLGAYLREVSALVLVFAPLDKLIQEGSISSAWWVGTVLVSISFLLIGIALEQGSAE
jgi:hypothetical protein